MIRAIVTDIEGTTTDIRFVHNVLFPYARERLERFIRSGEQREPVNLLLNELRGEIHQPAASVDQLIDTLFKFMDEDRKSPALKSIQGHIWREGYVNGDFTGHLYPDVVPALRRWSDQDIDIFIYSSGSVPAQKLLFSYSDEGDVSGLLSGFFDTQVGAKRQVSSYRNISMKTGVPVHQMLFLSDIHEELDAAREAGWKTLQLIRGEPDPQSTHPQVSRFDDIHPEQIPT
ncbi:acireductone synthase [Cronobacter muytjensii]|uniref:acireductone synthase n=1 Tax=Cronobacter muytjensii TaxID=413501 RepID=UPI0003A7E84F|nr:acireductone synthase [Cronobacter muytjensii]ALB71490.1 haloacid dehalogenase [Cronobacter muytjensii ATCC 51329]